MRRSLERLGPPWERVGIAFVLVLLGMIWQRVQARQLDREYNHLRLEVDRLRYENGKLATQINQKIAPTYLEAMAKERGLLPLMPAQRVQVKP
jgi:hypothetical protein